MQRVAFMMRFKPGTQEEYRRRHRQVWPELLADLKRAGCQNYSIYLRDTELFAYMEVDDFGRYLEIMATSRASERWEAQMSDILLRETEAATGFPPVLEEVFSSRLIYRCTRCIAAGAVERANLTCDPREGRSLRPFAEHLSRQQTYPGTKTSNSQAKVST